MKQTMGVGVLLAVAVAAARFVGAPTQGAPAGEARVVASALRPTKPPKPVDASYAGGCSAFEGKAPGKDAAQDPNRGAAKAVLDRFLPVDPNLPVGAEARAGRFAGVHFAVATAPDPRHTNLALGFDREMVLLQEAAQDDGFTYNSSWLPWTGEATTFPLLEDQQRNDDRRDEREACPGILLFRKGLVQPSKTDNGVADPYGKGLIVFVVGEQPTGGVNEEQWANTMHWLATNVPIPSVPAKATLNILGPNFSGSLPSVERDLAKLYADPSGKGADAAALQKRFANVRLLSGGVSSCSSIRWFQRQIEQRRFKGHVLFGSFAENDDMQIYRFLQYERAQGTDLNEMAILSEDETAYANPPSDRESKDKAGRCAITENTDERPVRLSYPRDISAVRAAYDKQAIFNARTAGAARPILKEDPDLESPNDQATDTIHAYSGSLSAIAQEAVLYGIVTTLRRHHTRFLLLRSSNPLDFLFLTRFFHQAYPEARVVTVTSDLLFRREIDTTEFRGVLALSNYPLLSRNGHWSRLSELPSPAPLHTHRVFDANNEGTYIAGRYLFDPQQRGVTPDRNGHLALPLLEDLPDYADPFWMTRPLPPPAQTSAPVWLSVLGRDGYWPVAVLNEQTTPKAKPLIDTPPSTIVRLTTSPEVHYDLAQAAPNAKARFSKSLLFTFPFAWTLSVVLACGLLLFQLFAIVSDSGLTSSGLFAPFRQMRCFPSQAVLLGFNTTFATMPALLLFSVAMVVPRLEYVDKMGRNFWFWLAVCGFAIVGLTFTLLLHREKHNVPVPGSEAPRQETVLRLRPDGGLAAGVYVVSLLVLGTLAASILHFSHNQANDAALFLRMVHLTSGVSPLAPPLLILLGFYLWTWQALAGNVLLADGRPRLPAYTEHAANQHRGVASRLYAWLRFRPAEPRHAPGCSLGRADFRISEGMGRRIFDVAGPLSLDLRVVGIPLLIAAVVLSPFTPRALPLLSMEGWRYAVAINVALLLALLLTTAEALRLQTTWIELRRLLVALNRLRLRRTFARLRAIPQGSLWSVSGSVQRTQMQFFSQGMDAARRLRACIGDALPSLDDAIACGDLFTLKSAPKVAAGPRWEKLIPMPIQRQVHLRVAFAEATADILNGLLMPAWAREQESLNLVCDGSLQTEEGEGRASLNLALSEEPAVRAAEEFVCLQYIAFIQNVLARMRTMVLSMGLLFVAVCLAISFYPFVPRTQIGLWMGADLLLIAASVITVYAGLERDNTLSYMTNTVPGRLGGEFYVKTATFLVGPVVGLLTTQFPAISEFVLGFLQPGLDAIK